MADLYGYTCPTCGGALAFDVELQMLKCPFCENTFDAEQMNKARDEDVASSAQPMTWAQDEQKDLLVYSCNSCGGEIIADASTGATTCPYCNNPVVMIGQFSGTLRPDFIIPFKLDKKSAIEALKKHYNKRPFLPSLFKTQNKLNEIKGIYVPFWHFDAMVEADIEYSAQKVRTWSDSDYNYTETETYRVNREGSVKYWNVPVDASSKMPDEMMDSLEPYYYGEATRFNTAYMAGYLADKFDIDKDDCRPRADDRMMLSTEKMFSETLVGFNSFSKTKRNFLFSDVVARYTLLPVWFLVTSWNNQTYTFAMNGQTGKFVGELPTDKKKFRLSVLYITLGLFGIVTALFFASMGGSL